MLKTTIEDHKADLRIVALREKNSPTFSEVLWCHSESTKNEESV